MEIHRDVVMEIMNTISKKSVYQFSYRNIECVIEKYVDCWKAFINFTDSLPDKSFTFFDGFEIKHHKILNRQVRFEYPRDNYELCDLVDDLIRAVNQFYNEFYERRDNR